MPNSPVFESTLQHADRPALAAAPALPQRLPALDTLRGLAILLVLGHNLEQLNGAADWLSHGIELVFDIGWVGVQLFFVLSGFLITRILLETQDDPHYYRAFYGRRTLRIFPLYYATLLVLFVGLPLAGVQPAALRDDHSLPLWLYLSNWTAPLGWGGESVPHFWSLAVEEQFYLVWPLLVHHRTPAQVLRLTLGIALASLLARSGLLAYGVDARAVYEFTVSRIDALALGAAAAALLVDPTWRARLARHCTGLWAAAVGISAAGLLITHGYPQFTPLEQTLGYSLLALTFALVVAASALGDARSTSPATGNPGTALLRLFGKYSYAIYVFHKPLHDFIGKPWLQAEGLFRSNRLGPALAYVAGLSLVSLLAAMLSYHLFEKHFLALKDRWFALPARA